MTTPSVLNYYTITVIISIVRNTFLFPNAHNHRFETTCNPKIHTLFQAKKKGLISFNNIHLSITMRLTQEPQPGECASQEGVYRDVNGGGKKKQKINKEQ